MEVVMTAVTIRHVMQSYSQINKWAQNFLQAGYPWCRQTNIVKALNGEAWSDSDKLTEYSCYMM